MSPDQGTIGTKCVGTEVTSTVFTGELYGTYMAIKHIEACTWAKSFHVFTDNQAVLRDIMQPRQCSGGYLLRRIVDIIDRIRTYTYATQVSFHWIPAHVGVKGNEAADEAAKAGARQGDQAANICVHRAAVKTLIKREAARSWAADWAASEHGRHTARIIPVPTATTLQKHRALPKTYSAVIVQASTGKIGLRKYLFDIGRADEQWCQHCGSASRNGQTVRHVLVECPGFQQLRHTVFGRAAWDLDHKKLLSDPTGAKKAATFMLRTGLLEQFAATASRAIQTALQGDKDGTRPPGDGAPARPPPTNGLH